MTGEQLKKLLPGIEIRDRSTEELDGLTMLRCLQRGSMIQVRGHYVQHREQINCPYESKYPAPSGGSASIEINGPFDKEDFIALSVGGNDFALRGEMDPTEILRNVRELIKYYKNKGVKKERIIYFTPYPPTGLMKFAVAVTCRGNLNSLYR